MLSQQQETILHMRSERDACARRQANNENIFKSADHMKSNFFLAKHHNKINRSGQMKSAEVSIISSIEKRKLKNITDRLLKDKKQLPKDEFQDAVGDRSMCRQNEPQQAVYQKADDISTGVSKARCGNQFIIARKNSILSSKSGCNQREYSSVPANEPTKEAKTSNDALKRREVRNSSKMTQSLLNQRREAHRRGVSEPLRNASMSYHSNQKQDIDLASLCRILKPRASNGNHQSLEQQIASNPIFPIETDLVLVKEQIKPHQFIKEIKSMMQCARKLNFEDQPKTLDKRTRMNSPSSKFNNLNVIQQKVSSRLAMNSPASHSSKHSFPILHSIPNASSTNE